MTRRGRIGVERHQEHGWRWRVVLLTGTERPADAQEFVAALGRGQPAINSDVLAQGCAPTEALAQQRAFGAWEIFGSDYPGHYELVSEGGA